MVWCGICIWLCYKFPTESNSERILKIGQYLVKLCAWVKCLVFWLTVYKYLVTLSVYWYDTALTWPTVMLRLVHVTWTELNSSSVHVQANRNVHIARTWVRELCDLVRHACTHSLRSTGVGRRGVTLDQLTLGVDYRSGQFSSCDMNVTLCLCWC